MGGKARGVAQESGFPTGFINDFSSLKFIFVFFISNSFKCCEWDIYDSDRVLLQKPEIYISKSPELLNYSWAERSKKSLEA